MKLIACHIENFGKLRNFDYEFSGGLSEILQDNGWGKTTFCVFIKAMLYGMSKKGNTKAYIAERSKYAPWQGGVYGGTLTFEHKGHKYKMYRTFGATPERDMFSVIDLETNLRTKKFSEEIGYEIYGVGRDTFEITTYFPQSAVSTRITDEMRANLSGINEIQNDLKNFSSAVGDIEDKIKKYKRELNSLTKNEDIMKEISKLEKQIEDEEDKILKLQDEVEVKSEELDSLKEDYENANREKELIEVSKNEITDIKDALIAKKSELLAFQIKLQELEKENLRRGIKNKFALSNRKARTVLYYGAITTLLVLLTLFVFEFIYKIIVAFRYVTLAAILVDVGLIVYCLLSKFHTKDKFNQKIELDGYVKQIDNLKEDIEKLQTVLDAKESNMPEIKIGNEKQSSKIIENYTACEKSIFEKKVQINMLQKNIEGYEITKENLVNDQITIEERRLKINEQLKLLGYVKSFMNTAKENVSKRYIAPMQSKFTKIIQQILVEDAKKYMIDIDLNISVDEATGSKEVEYLSQGYQDLMNICRRFSLIESIFEKEKPVIILDDPFVNLDDRIAENSIKLIKKLAKSYQIVYLYCHSSRKI